MKRRSTLTTAALGALILLLLCAHVVLTASDSARVSRLARQVQLIKVGDTLAHVVSIMGRPDAQYPHHADTVRGLESGPVAHYHRWTKWTDPFYPVRIHQGCYEGVNIDIYCNTSGLVTGTCVFENTQ